MTKITIKTGFTLIELLIVVAIIAILAAIAVPNFLEAQTRAKVSRARADMRSLSTGLETYYIDNNTYVFQNPQYRALRFGNGLPVLEFLTTPIAYMNSISSLTDPFKANAILGGQQLQNLNTNPGTVNTPEEKFNFSLYKYFARNSATAAIVGRAGDPKPTWYIIGSAGPDGVVENLNDALTNTQSDNEAARILFYNRAIYDSTNGTTSHGSLYRVGGTPSGNGKAFYYVAQSSQ